MHPNKQRVLMFCGPDMCGKTQIAKKLSEVTDIPYFKATSEHDSFISSRTTMSKRDLFLNQLRYADPRVFDVLKQAGWSIIFDRAFPCEFAYSRAFGRETDVNMLRHMDEMWASIGATVVLCHRSSYKGIVDDLDPSIKEEALTRIHDHYMEFVRWTKCKVLLLNVDDEDLVREVNDILGFMGWSQRVHLSGAV
jgi:hypothetical protein